MPRSSRIYKRDARGRFASGGGGGGGSRGPAQAATAGRRAPRRKGAMIAVTMNTSTGRDARLRANTARAEAAGAKQRAQRDQRDSKRRLFGVRYSQVKKKSGLPEIARRRGQEANLGKMQVKQIQRERRSLLRRSRIHGGRG